MDIALLKKTLQDHFTDGLAIIIGSGLSAAYGLPTMWALEKHLRTIVPTLIPDTLKGQWADVEARLAAGRGLELALQDVYVSSELERIIVKATGDFVAEKEIEAISKRLLSGQLFPFANLLKKAILPIIPSDGLPVISTNYDRLIEYAIESTGTAVNSLFHGHMWGTLDPKSSKDALVDKVHPIRRNNYVVRYRPHVNVYKPHGSLDWFEYQDSPIRCPLSLNAPRLIITPGSGKYRKGYEKAFETHRAQANDAIEKASRYLIIGYGFNDDHLETRLRTEIKKGKSCVLLTMGLTANSKQVTEAYPNVLAVTRYDTGSEQGTEAFQSGNTYRFPGINIWNLEDFVKEVYL
ncbi:MAG TPA: SIR2 family protein [Archangium sp.]|uniref:SIR2 family protein n=1 Tax=Archangium sp. TaxID=1872627 RepID=UPI002E35E9D1|nr:SIR2 family protein [Archangium sp.]HEX5745515.1 SIR2 family protein [Archangium sp.]